MKRSRAIINILAYFVLSQVFGFGLIAYEKLTNPSLSYDEVVSKIDPAGYSGIVTILLFLTILGLNYDYIKSKISYGIEKLRETLSFGFGGYGTLLLCNIALALVLGLLNLNNPSAENEEVVQELIKGSPIFFSIIIIGLVTPCLEELIFRVSYMALFTEDKYTKKWYPYILCALLFALIHDYTIFTNFGVESIFTFLSYFLPSLVIAIVYRKSNHNLLAVILIHMLNNTVPIILLGVIS
ncbi:membrane protease YdiL (CAAX protease family) [Bacilli bacterium PM5-9]|nr:membrane protease YdiL (CAAX protease family) [Bacilli bacterium PM5-9]